MSNVRIDYDLRGESLQQTVDIDALPSTLDLMHRHRAVVRMLTIGVTVPEHVTQGLRQLARDKRINLTLSPMGV